MSETNSEAKFSKIGLILIIGLVIVLIVVDIYVLYPVYVAGVEKPNLWEYLGSDQFALVTGSLLIPIVLASVNEVFAIRKSIKERTQKEQDEKHDRFQKALDAMHEQRIKCIEVTSDTWLKLFELVVDVEYADTEEKIKEVAKKLENYIDSTGKTVYLLSVHFADILTVDKINLFVRAINFMVCSASSAAFSITNAFITNPPQDPKQIIRMSTQFPDELEMIQNRVRRVFYHPFLQLLQAADQVLVELANEIKEDKKKLSKKAEEYKKGIETLCAMKNYEEMTDLERKNYDGFLNTLSEKKEEQKKLLNEVVSKIQLMKTWISAFDVVIKDNSKLKELQQYAESLGTERLMPLSKLTANENLKKFLNECEDEGKWKYDERIKALKVDYSPECVQNLAKWVSMENLARGVRKLAK